MGQPSFTKPTKDLNLKEIILLLSKMPAVSIGSLDHTKKMIKPLLKTSTAALEASVDDTGPIQTMVYSK
ncbi:hypothetical protein A3J44_04085 [candidate division WOR-1 bacterium RIFCSPHIGHO2_02_FULL_45_12]|nr:MAG: hypothetical protein A3J44_04085 [candidate division WOR-1 bacterium RIFCSPHIGHO2_02_FULL_45_12]